MSTAIPPVEDHAAARCADYLRALLISRPARDNDEKLSSFFFLEFAGDPAAFLHFLRHCKHELLRPESAELAPLLAARYLAVLSPLAERFGIFHEKSEVDTACFRILQPQDYAHVMKFIADYEQDAAEMIVEVQGRLQDFLQTNGIQSTVSGRFKEPYSIYRKMRKRALDTPVTLHDIFAFRIILERNDRDECFEVLNMLHDRFDPVANRFKDYISIPKPNGYQSIHTCLSGLLPGLDLPVEVQIRTRVMHEFAERGLASHWLYARSKKAMRMTRTEERLLQHMRVLSDGKQSRKFVTCFTPGGDIVVLPALSTVRDFAFAVHTDLGRRASGAAINGLPASLQTELHNLDRIEINTPSNVYACA